MANLCLAHWLVRALRGSAALICLAIISASCPSVSNGATDAGLKSLRRIDHFALNVKSVEVSAKFYETVFGFPIVNKWQGVWMVGNDMIRIGLFEFPNATSIDKPDERLVIAHVAFLTDEAGFKACVEQVEHLGIPHDPLADTGIAKSLFFHDPDGHELEITYYYKKQPTL